MSDTVTYEREDIVGILKDLETIVASLDRLRSLEPHMPPEDFARLLDEFTIEWDVSPKLAAARGHLSEAFDYDELETLMADVGSWRLSARKPPGDV